MQQHASAAAAAAFNNLTAFIDLTADNGDDVTFVGYKPLPPLPQQTEDEEVT
jgi:hypothetical protein